MIRFGIIGAGRIAHTFAQAIEATSGKIHAVASRDLNRAKSFQETYGIERAYDSYQALYEDSAVDIVYVATPHGLHAAHMQEALTYQKALLTEKAFTLNADQARDILKRAKAQNVFVMEAMWTRFLPVVQAVQEKLEKGTIGPLKELHATFSFAGDLNEAGRLVNPHLGGGALLDVGIYPLTVADLFGTLNGTITSDVKKTVTGVDGWNHVRIQTPELKMVLESGIFEN
jgi:predicted dehydrogenase